MKFVLGDPRWFELHLDGARWWRSIKGRLSGSPKPREGEPRPGPAQKGTPPKRRRVFFDWP